MRFKKKNEKERMEFVDFWADYVKSHPDKVWSKQQNVIINSSLKAANFSREDYLLMKDEPLLIKDKPSKRLKKSHK